MELIEGSETSANHNRTPGKYPKECIQDSKHGESLKSRILIMDLHSALFSLCIIATAVELTACVGSNCTVRTQTSVFTVPGGWGEGVGVGIWKKVEFLFEDARSWQQRIKNGTGLDSELNGIYVLLSRLNQVL